MTGDALDLTVDPDRAIIYRPTGILVRAQHEGKWVNADIATLDRRSLLTWLRSRGDAPRTYPEAVVLALLGHSPTLTAVPEGDQ